MLERLLAIVGSVGGRRVLVVSHSPLVEMVASHVDRLPPATTLPSRFGYCEGVELAFDTRWRCTGVLDVDETALGF